LANKTIALSNLKNYQYGKQENYPSDFLITLPFPHCIKRGA
jgi:hypothetical protein